MSFLDWLLGRQRTPRDVAQSELDEELSHWQIAEINNPEQGVRAIARTRVERPNLPNLASFTTAVAVSWPYESDGDFPDDDTQAAMDVLEVVMEDLSAENDYAYLIQVRTGLGERRWLYYTADAERFTTEFNARLHAAGNPPLRIDVSQDPDWTEWRELVDALRSRSASN